MHESDQAHEQSLLAAAALGALDPSDLPALEHLLATSPTARAELQQLREIVAMLPYAAAPAIPPARTRARLLERIAADQARQPLPAQPKPARRNSWLMPVAAALLTLLVLLFGGLTLSLQRQVADLTATNQQLLAAVTELRDAVASNEAQQARLTAQLADYERQIAHLNEQVAQERLLVSFVSAPGVATRELRPARAGLAARGEMYMYPGQSQAVVVFSGLPPLPPGYVYRFWLSDGSHHIDAGAVQVDAGGLATLIVSAPREVNAFTEVMLTVEPSTDPDPTEVEIVLTGTL